VSRPRVAWFTPLQPVESGISLYNEDLLPILSSVIDIDVIVDNYIPSRLQGRQGLQIRRCGEYTPDSYDLVVYQMGNSPVHVYMLDETFRTPGLLVLHDTMLNHLFIQHAARTGTLNAYCNEMEERYGPPGARAAERVLKGQSPEDLFRFPMSESLVDRSRATIVHSEFAREQLLSLVPGAHLYRIPLGVQLPEEVDRAFARRALGIPEDQFLIATVSHINPHKRIHVVLRALKHLRRSIPARLILAGSISPNFPVQRMVNHLGLDQVVDLPGYVTDHQARLIAAAADVIVNLRFPTAGETSASLLHSMAAGRTVLVSGTGAFAEIPKRTVVTIPVDSLEEPMLVAALQRLWDDTGLRESIGESARDFVRIEHSLQRWVDGYIRVISEVTGTTIDRPEVIATLETVNVISATDSPYTRDELIDSLAQDIAELGLGGDESLLREIATSQVELGLGVGMINAESARRSE
jgi:glycosyltransferase involved in cell wall biosynthesis